MYACAHTSAMRITRGLKMEVKQKQNGWVACALVLLALCIASAFLPWYDASITEGVTMPEKTDSDSYVLSNDVLSLVEVGVPYLRAVLIFTGISFVVLAVALIMGRKAIVRTFAVVSVMGVALAMVLQLCGMQAYSLSNYSDYLASFTHTELLSMGGKCYTTVTTDVGIGFILMPMFALILCFTCFKATAPAALEKQPDIRRLCVCAMLVAIGVILSGVLSVPSFMLGQYSMKIGLGALATILAGVLYGAGYGAIVGALVDIIQAMLFPKGPYVPWFTIVAMFSGLIPGLFFMRRKHLPIWWVILIAVFAGQVTCSVFANSLLLVSLYNIPWEILITPRVINQAIMIPVYTVLIWAIIQLFAKTKLLYKFTDYPKPSPAEVLTDAS